MARIIKAPQGSPEWHQHRARHFNASEAAAALGIDPNIRRGDLLHEKHIGFREEPGAFKQKIFDQGHEYEAIARPWAEEIIGEDLYPVVLADDVEGVPMSASLDGLTMDDSVSWEHKQLNKKLAAALDEGYILDEYKPQMEQGFALSGATRCLFMASNGDRESMRCAWYESDPALRQKVIAGWKQFQKDLEAYEPPVQQPEVLGRAPEHLPPLRVEVKGEVVASNLGEFKEQALAVFRGINTDLKTDKDFANAEATSKWCKGVEDKLQSAKEHALGQAEDLYSLLKTVDEISEEARQTRLALDRQVKQMKEQRKAEILENAKIALRHHIDSIQKLLKGPGGQTIALPDIPADFAGAMRGKKTLRTLREAVDTELANAKIAADQAANGIRANLEVYSAEVSGHGTLFPDMADLLRDKEPDDLRNLIRARIAEHKQAEAERRQAEERERQQAAEKDKAASLPPDTSQPKPDPAPPVAGEQEQTGKTTAPVTEGVPPKPSDREIVEVVARAFGVTAEIAESWLADMRTHEAAEA